MKAQSQGVTIRMGASEWSVNIATKTGPVKLNLREMSKDDRRKFHSDFMGAYRASRKRTKK